MKYKCGMYGGSFNPLHLGHVRCIIEAANQCEELILVISEGINRDEIDIRVRYRWVYQLTKHMGKVRLFVLQDAAKTKEAYGQVALNALYYLPTQFIGMYMWKKHMNEDINAVKSKKMSPKQVGGYIFVTALGIVGCQYILELLGGKQTWLDSTTLIISIVANALMVLRYKEQWALWIVVDIITVTMWILAGDMIQVSMWSIYLLNAFYGFYKWSKMNKVNLENE